MHQEFFYNSWIGVLTSHVHPLLVHRNGIEGSPNADVSGTLGSQRVPGVKRAS